METRTQKRGLTKTDLSKERIEPIVKAGPWDLEIKDLETFFQEIRRPRTAVRLSRGEVIVDINSFIQSHLNILKAQNGNERYRPYLNRLNALKIILS